MEQYLKLFTKVEDGLPEENIKVQVCITSWKMCTMGILRNDGWEIHASGEWIKVSETSDSVVTHWLDLSKLTTIEAAKQLIEESWVGGHKYCEDRNNGSYPQFLIKNLNRL